LVYDFDLIIQNEVGLAADSEKASRIVILFDACAPKMEECVPGRCESDPTILCKHRFEFDFYILNGINGQSYLSSVMLFDFQVILHFLYFIFQGRVPGPKNSKFVIVTKDKKFLQSAQNEWQQKAKKKTRPRLSFGSNFVRNGKIVIYIECIDSKAYGSNRYDDRIAIIEHLNRRFGK